MLAGLVLVIFRGFLYLRFLYLMGFDDLGLFCFGVLYCFFDFMLLGCFFDFLGGLIFGFFDAFLMIFGFFYDFFSGLLLWFYSPKWVLFLKFSCNSFFLEYINAALMRGHAKRHRPEFCGFGSGI